MKKFAPRWLGLGNLQPGSAEMYVGADWGTIVGQCRTHDSGVKCKCSGLGKNCRIMWNMAISAEHKPLLDACEVVRVGA